MNVFEMEMILYKKLKIRIKKTLIKTNIQIKIIKILEIFILNLILFNFLNSFFT